MSEVPRRRRLTVKQALAQARGAVADLERAPNPVKVVQAIEANLAHAEALAGQLRDEYEELVTEMEVQREVTLRLITASNKEPIYPAALRQLEESLRGKLLHERLEGHAQREAAPPAKPVTSEPSASPRYWACALEDAEIYRMGLPSRAAAVAALEGHCGEVISYERGFPVDVATELFDVDNLLSRAEELALADRRVLGQSEYGLFDGLDEAKEGLRRALGEAFVGWVKASGGRVLAVVDREEIEVGDAEDVTS